MRLHRKAVFGAILSAILPFVSAHAVNLKVIQNCDQGGTQELTCALAQEGLANGSTKFSLSSACAHVSKFELIQKPNLGQVYLDSYSTSGLEVTNSSLGTCSYYVTAEFPLPPGKKAANVFINGQAAATLEVTAQAPAGYGSMSSAPNSSAALQILGDGSAYTSTFTVPFNLAITGPGTSQMSGMIANPGQYPTFGIPDVKDAIGSRAAFKLTGGEKGTLKFFLNTAGQLVNDCLGDLNGDSLINSADLGVLLGSWGGAGADLDGNGVTGPQDLAILLGLIPSSCN